jgi:hypothetical protein
MHDASYFRLTRGEAVALDPQARVLLEVCPPFLFIVHCSSPCYLLPCFQFVIILLSLTNMADLSGEPAVIPSIVSRL